MPSKQIEILQEISRKLDKLDKLDVLENELKQVNNKLDKLDSLEYQMKQMNKKLGGYDDNFGQLTELGIYGILKYQKNLLGKPIKDVIYNYRTFVDGEEFQVDIAVFFEDGQIGLVECKFKLNQKAINQLLRSKNLMQKLYPNTEISLYLAFSSVPKDKKAFEQIAKQAIIHKIKFVLISMDKQVELKTYKIIEKKGEVTL